MRSDMLKQAIHRERQVRADVFGDVDVTRFAPQAPDVQCASIGHGVADVIKPKLALKSKWVDATLPASPPFHALAMFDVSALHLPAPTPPPNKPYLRRGRDRNEGCMKGKGARALHGTTDDVSTLSYLESTTTTSYCPSHGADGRPVRTQNHEDSRSSITARSFTSREPSVTYGAPPATSRRGSGGVDATSSNRFPSPPSSVSSPPTSLSLSRASRLSKMSRHRRRRREGDGDAEASVQGEGGGGGGGGGGESAFHGSNVETVGSVVRACEEQQTRMRAETSRGSTGKERGGEHRRDRRHSSRRSGGVMW